MILLTDKCCLMNSEERISNKYFEFCYLQLLSPVRSATMNMFICLIHWLTCLINTLVDQYMMTIFVELCLCSRLICLLLAFVSMKNHTISLSAFYLLKIKIKMQFVCIPEPVYLFTFFKVKP